MPCPVPRNPPSKARREVDSALGGRRAPTGSTAPRRASASTRSTRRRRRSADRCTSATCSRTRTPTSSRASSACAARPCSIRWGGTTTACRPSGACRTTTACGAIRRCRTIRRSRRRPTPAKPPVVGLAAELRRALRAADGGGREGVRAALAPPRPVGRLVDDLRDDRPARAARLAAGVPAPAARRPARISSKRRRCGTWTSARRSRRPSSRTARCRARITASASRMPTAPGAVEIDTTRPELIPACVALVAHPDDARYQPLFGREVLTPLFDVPRAGHGASARRSREGHAASR